MEDTGLPIALHLDHGEDFDICKACIDGGFTSVMIDASSKHSFEENIAMTRKVVEYAHAPRRRRGGRAGPSGRHRGRRQRLRRRFLLHPTPTRWRSSSGPPACDSPGHRHRHQPRRLISSSRGTRSRQLRFDILEEVSRAPARLPHRAPRLLPPSPQEYVEMINAQRRQDARRHRCPGGSAAPGRRAGRLQDQHRLRPAPGHDCRRAAAARIADPANFDPRSYLKVGRQYVKDLVKDKIVNVLGSDNKI